MGGPMFINRNTYIELVAERASLERVLVEQSSRIAAQQSTIEWLMVRVTQVEHERAQLFERYTGVKIAAPAIVKAPETKPNDRSFDFPVSFTDMGNAEADAQGLGWNADGTLKV